MIELLVAIALFSIVVAIAASGFVNALRTQRQVSSLISAQSNVTLVLEQMAREVRTGYLFCHGLASTTPNNDPFSNDYCGCNVDASNVWTCDALDYYNAAGGHVNYSLRNGALAKSDTNAADPTAQSITGNDVSVKYLHFILYGNLEGDHWTPRVTVAIGVAPSSTDPGVSGDVLNMETTISARQIDCSAGGGC